MIHLPIVDASWSRAREAETWTHRAIEDRVSVTVADVLQKPVAGNHDEALAGLLHAAAEGTRHSGGAPAPDPRVSAAFALGWQMAEMYRPDEREQPRESARDDLPGLKRLSDSERVQVALQQVEAALTKLSDTLAKARVQPPSTLALRTQLGARNGVDDDTRRKTVRMLHVKVLAALTAADFRLGKAYHLGRRLADTSRKPTSAKDLADELAPKRVTKLCNTLTDLASVLPPHAGRSVAKSLKAWQAYIFPQREGPADLHRAGEVQRHLRRQGQLWRSLLSGEKAGQDMLELKNYVSASVNLFKTAAKLAGKFVWHAWLVTTLVIVLFAGGIAVMFVSGSSASIVAGAGGILASVGLSWRSTGSALGGLGAAAGEHLWGSELDNAIAEAITCLPKSKQPHGLQRWLRSLAALKGRLP